MGIRESLKEPSEEKLQDFVMPEDEQREELLFDVKKEITNEEWKVINSEVEKIIDRATKLGCVQLGDLPFLSFLKIVSEEYDYIDSDKKDKLLVILEKEKERHAERIDRWGSKLTFTEYSFDVDRCLGELGLLKIASLNVNYPFSQIQKSTITNCYQDDYYLAQGHVFCLGKLRPAFSAFFIARVLCPDQEIKLGLIVKQEFKDFVDSCADNPQNLDSDMLYKLANIKIIYPEVFENFPIKKIYKCFKKYLDASRRKISTQLFLRDISNFMILAAKKVEITDQYFKLEMTEKKSYHFQEKKRPERRM